MTTSSGARVSGQALPHGVMMSTGAHRAVAVRCRDGNTAVSVKKLNAHSDSNVPMIRGLERLGKSFAAMPGTYAAYFGLRKNNCKGERQNETERFPVKRLFMYHGAEHKTIHCWENGLELNTENISAQETYHPRCGSSVAAVTVISYAVLTGLIPRRWGEAATNTVSAICMLPALALGYESCKYTSGHNNKLAKVLGFPGKMVQKITAREPDESMIECAALAMSSALEGKNKE